MNAKVDAYLKKAKTWREESELLREIILDFPLTEELKWGKPCYSFQGSNILIIQGFKEYCALMFCKGSLLRDEAGVLIQQTEHVQAARQIRFTNAREIVKMKRILKAYIEEAIAAQKAGLEVVFKKITEHKVPEELQKKLDANRALKTAFAALTPGRQRGYYLHIGGAKQAKTREARVEKCTPQILAGKGMDD